MAKPIIGMVPPGGWHYIEGDTRISAATYDSLLKAVEHHRAENHLPIGDFTSDVNSYICSNWPHFCHGVDMVVVHSATPVTATAELMTDIQTWAKNITGGSRSILYVYDEVAEARAKTCLNCPNNVNWRSGCGSCIVVTDRVCANVRQGRDTASSQVLGGCRLQRHDNRAAIFLDKDMLQKASGIPETCWLNA